MNRILVFINSGKGTDWINGAAICAETGRFICGHTSSNYHWFRYDMGLDSDRQHDIYKEMFPEGYELVEITDPESNFYLKEAIRKYEFEQARLSLIMEEAITPIDQMNFGGPKNETV